MGLVKVSSRAHYGLRAMTELARAYGRGPVALSEIARAEHLSQGYLEQLIAALRRAGLVEATRGAAGGYQLARPPERISVYEVYRAVEGPIALVECADDGYVAGSCEREPLCASRGIWRRVRQAIEQVLSTTTLADLVREVDGEGACEEARAGFIRLDALQHGSRKAMCTTR